MADRLVEVVEAGPSGRVDDVGGPEVLDVDDLRDQYTEVLGRRPRCFAVPAAGKVLRAFSQGVQTAPEHRFGTITWPQFLATHRSGA